MPYFNRYTLILAFCVSLFLGRPDQALAETTCAAPAFLIKGVKVEAESISGDAARKIAMNMGIEKSWQRLKSRLVLDEQPDAEDISTEDISNLIDYTRLVRETVLSQRYLAEFDYCYDRDLVRAHFRETSQQHAELVSGRMLVLPVWNIPGQPRIWRQPNHWLEAWRLELSGHDGLVSLFLPKNLATERAVEAEAIAKGEAKMIATAARLEKAERVIITTITPAIAESGDGQALNMNAKARLYNRNGKLESEFYSLNDMLLPANKAEKTLRWLSGEIIDDMEDVWRKTNVLAHEPVGSIEMFVPAKDVKVWSEALKTIEGLAPVHSITVLHVDADGGLLRVNLNSSMRSLSYALETAGLMLKPGPDAAGGERLNLLPLDQ